VYAEGVSKICQEIAQKKEYNIQNTQNSDARESPKIKNKTFRTQWKFEIKNSLFIPNPQTKILI
jgi:hypothetical protein